MFREQGGTPSKTIEEKRAELAAKRAANAAKEKSEAEGRELERLDRDIEIEDKLAEAYAAGVKEEQILELTWRGVGRCIARIPRDGDWRHFAKKAGFLQGELKNDPAIHDELA